MISQGATLIAVTVTVWRINGFVDALIHEEDARKKFGRQIWTGINVFYPAIAFLIYLAAVRYWPDCPLFVQSR